jgi:hypothetical protein
MERSTRSVLTFGSINAVILLFVTVLFQKYSVSSLESSFLPTSKIILLALVFMVLFGLYYYNETHNKTANWTIGKGMFFTSLSAVLFSFVFKYAYSLLFLGQLAERKSRLLSSLKATQISEVLLKQKLRLFDFYNSAGFVFFIHFAFVLILGLLCSILVSIFTFFKK